MCDDNHDDHLDEDHVEDRFEHHDPIGACADSRQADQARLEALKTAKAMQESAQNFVAYEGSASTDTPPDTHEFSQPRRRFLNGMAMAAMAGVMMPSLSWANAPTNKRLIVIILRGAMDGLAATVPYGDPAYVALRKNLAIERDALLNLDGFFALHPSFETLYKMYQDKQMAIVHAAASPYRQRSHFDAQNVLELGGTTPHGLDSGWMNRLVGLIEQQSAQERGTRKLGMAFGQSIPMAMRGKTTVGSWAPSTLPEVGSDFYSLVSYLYKQDAALQSALYEGLDIQDTTGNLFDSDMRQMARQSRSRKGFVTMAEMTGTWMKEPDGPRIASLELGGWDTHANQGTAAGGLANNFGLLDQGFKALKDTLGDAWGDTVVLAITEFGRTCAPNGNNGTDHGTASCTFVAGGAVKGGRVLADWPGLTTDRLYEGRDLRPTVDLRSVFKGVLSDHFGLSLAALNAVVYPNSESAPKLNGLII